VHEDVADGVVELVEDVDLVLRLQDLKRKRHVGDARDARQVALRFRIRGRAVRVVLLLLRQRLRPVRDLVPLDNPLACGHAERRAVILDVPGGGARHLPEAGDVRLAVRGLRRRVRWTRGLRLQGDERARADKGGDRSGSDQWIPATSHARPPEEEDHQDWAATKSTKGTKFKSTKQRVAGPP